MALESASSLPSSAKIRTEQSQHYPQLEPFWHRELRERRVTILSGLGTGLLQRGRPCLCILAFRHCTKGTI